MLRLYFIFTQGLGFMSHQKVLDKLLDKKRFINLEEQVGPLQLVQDFLQKPSMAKKARGVGRPVVDKKNKARNFTVCMAPQYIRFLDAFNPPIKKIQGRGRKIRFIIDEFIRMSKRQKSQLKYLQEALKSLDEALNGLSGEARKDKRPELTSREKQLISTHVNRVKILSQILSFSTAELKKILPQHDWSLYSFCLNWNQHIK